MFASSDPAIEMPDPIETESETNQHTTPTHEFKVISKLPPTPAPQDRKYPVCNPPPRWGWNDRQDPWLNLEARDDDEVNDIVSASFASTLAAQESAARSCAVAKNNCIGTVTDDERVQFLLDTVQQELSVTLRDEEQSCKAPTDTQWRSDGEVRKREGEEVKQEVDHSHFVIAQTKPDEDDDLFGDFDEDEQIDDLNAAANALFEPDLAVHQAFQMSGGLEGGIQGLTEQASAPFVLCQPEDYKQSITPNFNQQAIHEGLTCTSQTTERDEKTTVNNPSTEKPHHRVPSPTESMLSAMNFQFHSDLPEDLQIARFNDKAFRKALREVSPELPRKMQWYAWQKVNNMLDVSDETAKWVTNKMQTGCTVKLPSENKSSNVRSTGRACVCRCCDNGYDCGCPNGLGGSQHIPERFSSDSLNPKTDCGCNCGVNERTQRCAPQEAEAMGTGDTVTVPVDAADTTQEDSRIIYILGDKDEEEDIPMDIGETPITPVYPVELQSWPFHGRIPGLGELENPAVKPNNDTPDFGNMTSAEVQAAFRKVTDSPQPNTNDNQSRQTPRPLSLSISTTSVNENIPLETLQHQSETQRRFISAPPACELSSPLGPPPQLTSLELISRPDTPRASDHSVRPSVEPEYPPPRWYRESTPAYEDRSPSPSPISRSGDNEIQHDTDMLDAPSQYYREGSMVPEEGFGSTTPRMRTAISSPDPLSSPVTQRIMITPVSQANDYATNAYPQNQTAYHVPAPPIPSTPSPLKSSRRGRRKSAVQGSKIEKLSIAGGSKSRNVTQKLTAGMRKATEKLVPGSKNEMIDGLKGETGLNGLNGLKGNGLVASAVAKIERNVEEQQKMDKERRSRSGGNTEGDATPRRSARIRGKVGRS